MNDGEFRTLPRERDQRESNQQNMEWSRAMDQLPRNVMQATVYAVLLLLQLEILQEIGAEAVIQRHETLILATVFVILVFALLPLVRALLTEVTNRLKKRGVGS